MFAHVRKLSPKNVGASVLTMLVAIGASSPALASDHGGHRDHGRDHHYSHRQEFRRHHHDPHFDRHYVDRRDHYRWHHHRDRLDGDYALGLLTGYVLGLSTYD
jgi:hypothetical protein